MVYIVKQEPTESTSISARGYDAERQVLAVTFKNGSVWHYASVPASVAEDFFTAPSAGRFYAAFIKGQFSAEKMTGPCPKCGDTGIIGTKCEDCGCADYEKEPRPFIEEHGVRTPIGGGRVNADDTKTADVYTSHAQRRRAERQGR